MMFHHDLNAEAPIHRAFFQQMMSVEPEAKAPVVPVVVVFLVFQRSFIQSIASAGMKD